MWRKGQVEERNSSVARKLFPYDRFSDDPQEAGTSAQRQAEMIRSTAAEYDAEIDNSYSLSDRGVSGFRGENVKKKLGLFIRLCQEGVVRKGDLLCIERVNRLSRMVWTEQVKLWEQILNFGVVIVTCEPRAEYTAKSIGRLEQGCPLAVFMMLAHQSSEEKSQWIAYSHKISREKAMADGSPHGKHCPAWLRPVGQSHPLNPKRRITERWEVIPERKALIQRIHRMVWEGASIDTISGFWHPKSRTLHLTEDEDGKTYAHEIAHALAGPNHELTNDPEWQAAFEAEKDKLDNRANPKSSPQEWFAELFSLAISEPKRWEKERRRLPLSDAFLRRTIL